jgi:hypothetical protein
MQEAFFSMGATFRLKSPLARHLANDQNGERFQPAELTRDIWRGRDQSSSTFPEFLKPHRDLFCRRMVKRQIARA